MLTEVRQAILPLALRRDAARWDDLGRAGLLIESLARHWRDPAPFKLLVVAPRRDAGELGTHLPRFDNIQVTVRAESDFFAPFSAFYSLRGWHRQQIVKLHVPVVLGFAAYLTLDADVCCVGDFDARTFVAEDGRLRSQWAHKYRHAWWELTARAVGISYAPLDHGMAVTPNVLHGALAAQALDYFRFGPFSPTMVLSAWLMRRPRSIPWTEYAIYTSVAERMGNLLQYHVPWNPARETPLLSYSHSVWHPSQGDRLRLFTPKSPPDAPFVVIQSATGIPLAQVRDAVDRL